MVFANSEHPTLPRLHHTQNIPPLQKPRVRRAAFCFPLRWGQRWSPGNVSELLAPHGVTCFLWYGGPGRPLRFAPARPGVPPSKTWYSPQRDPVLALLQGGPAPATERSGPCDRAVQPLRDLVWVSRHLAHRGQPPSCVAILKITGARLAVPGPAPDRAPRFVGRRRPLLSGGAGACSRGGREAIMNAPQ